MTLSGVSVVVVVVGEADRLEGVRADPAEEEEQVEVVVVVVVVLVLVPVDI